MITENVEYSEDRFIKNEYFFEDISRSLLRNSCQSSLKMKKVVIVGLGGLGTVVLKNLVAIGVMEFTIVDADVVDISNLNRQLYFTYKDIGKS
ncbi:ThiF family adenylyltransferase, partial [Enterococcus faecalis]|nr:ThiF family adenylyltransferase [Enterococcus faecalis]